MMKHISKLCVDGDACFCPTIPAEDCDFCDNLAISNIEIFDEDDGYTEKVRVCFDHHGEISERLYSTPVMFDPYAVDRADYYAGRFA